MPGKNQRLWLTSDSVSVEVDAAPERLYDLIADLPQMGRWSPECSAVEWTHGAAGPVVGARFLGRNKTGPRGLITWSRKGRVIVADRGHEFAFVTEEGGKEGVVWRYRFARKGDRTVVTESYEVHKIPVWARILDVPTNRHKQLLAGMTHTLARLKAAAESTSLPGRSR